MAGRDEKEPWYWQHESLTFDSETPLVITPSFWEEFTETEGDSPIFYGVAPVMDTRNQPSSAACYAFAVDQGSDNHGSCLSEYSQQHGERCKRRRMLHFAGAKPERIASGSSSYVNILGTPAALHSPFESCTPPVVSGNEECVLPVPCGPSASSTSLWFPRIDFIRNSVLANAQQPGTKCIVRSFDETAYSVCEQMKASVLLFNDHNTGFVGGYTLQHSQQSQHLHLPQMSLDAQVTDVLQGPQTPFSKPPISGRKHSMGPSRFQGKSSNGVALPFALVKPSAAQGDVTLNDINQRLLCPPPTPVRKGDATKVAKPPAHSGAGLSGKSVVTRTKIHTEGNGTITIMRTRG